MKRNVFGALMTLVVAFAIAVPVVHAQQTILSAKVPFDFSVGGKYLPAGTYQIRELDRETLIANQNGHFNVLGIYSYAGPSKPGESKLVFDKVGDNYFLRQICASARDEDLAVPESKREKEMRAMRASNTPATGGVETVIVALR
jgi:hypothetical protein